MVRLIQILSVLLLLTLVVGAQTPLTPCSGVDINGPSEAEPGAPLVFKAKLTGAIQANKPEFKWKISAGTITSGEGTDEITVDSTGLGGVEVIATVEISGAQPGCKVSSSKATQVKAPLLTCGLPFDQYGDLAFEDEKARLDNFAIQLFNEPLAIGQIVMSAGQETFENETTERLARAKSYLVNVRGTDRNRIITLDCGFTQDLSIRLYIIPTGVAPFTCDTSAEIPFSDVKFTKPRPKSSKKWR